MNSKKKIKILLFGIVSGVLISISWVYGVNQLLANNISYSPKDATWKVSNVKDSLDYLYEKSNNNSSLNITTIKIMDNSFNSTAIRANGTSNANEGNLSSPTVSYLDGSITVKEEYDSNSTTTNVGQAYLKDPINVGNYKSIFIHIKSASIEHNIYKYQSIQAELVSNYSDGYSPALNVNIISQNGVIGTTSMTDYYIVLNTSNMTGSYYLGFKIRNSGSLIVDKILLVK